MTTRSASWTKGSMVGLAAMVAGSTMSVHAEPQPLLVLEHAALRDWVVDERDSGLVRAMEMLPARVRELRREIGDAPPEVWQAADILLGVVSRPHRFSIVHNPDDQAGGFFGYGAAFSVHKGERNAVEELESAINRLLNRALRESDTNLRMEDSERFEGHREFAVPPGLISFGKRQAGNEWWYDVFVGSVSDPAQGLAGLPQSPRGVKPFLRGQLDLKGLNPALEIARGMAGQDFEDAEPIIARFERMGFIGEHAMKIDFQAGYSADASVTTIEVHDAKRFAEELGLPTESLSAEDLRAVPADAVFASVARFDLGQIERMLDEMAEHGMEIDEFFEEFEDETGVDIRRDILQGIGGTGVFYMADSTGGGNLMSSVLMMTYKNRDRFLEAHDKLMRLANGALEDNDEVGKYVRLTPWKHGDVELISLRFRGLPIPLELSYAATDKWFVAGLTPQAVIAAVQQARGGGDAGLGSVPEVAAIVKAKGSVSSVSYMDAARLGRSGYWMVSLGGSAIANAMRSPGGDRDPGLVVPTYRALMKGARPTVDIGYWNGSTFAYESHGDRSLLVQGAIAGGLVTQFAPVVAAVIGGAAAASRAHGGMRAAPWGMLLMDDQAAAAIQYGAFVDPAERAILGVLTAGSAARVQAEWQEMVERWESFFAR